MKQTLFSNFPFLRSDAISRWGGWTLAPQDFGASVNLILTMEGRLCPPHYCYPTRT